MLDIVITSSRYVVLSCLGSISLIFETFDSKHRHSILIYELIFVFECFVHLVFRLIVIKNNEHFANETQAPRSGCDTLCFNDK